MYFNERSQRTVARQTSSRKNRQHRARRCSKTPTLLSRMVKKTRTHDLVCRGARHTYTGEGRRALARTQPSCYTNDRPSDRRGPGLLGHKGRNVRSTCRCSHNLRITRRRAVSCGLHRPTSLVIHRSGLSFSIRGSRIEKNFILHRTVSVERAGLTELVFLSREKNQSQTGFPLCIDH